MKTLTKLTLAVATLLTATLVLAQEKGHLNISTVVQKEEMTVTDSGERRTKLVPADTVVPGDSVLYTITFRNVSDDVAENVVITNPMPENLTYISGSAFAPGTVIEYSIDGGENYDLAENLTVNDSGGARAARAEDFTHVRFVMQDDLAPGAEGVARFRAKLN